LLSSGASPNRFRQTDVCFERLKANTRSRRLKGLAGIGQLSTRTRTSVYRIFDSEWTRRTDGISLALMKDLFNLLLGILASLFKSKAKLEAEILILRQQINVLRRRAPKRPHFNNIDRFLFVWAVSLVPLRPGRHCDCQAGNDHSLAPRWVSSVLALAIAQPCWQTEGRG
jgi:hypothetical protein